MMSAMKLDAGASFPKFEVAKFGGGVLNVGTPSGDHDWQLVIVYRGKHCPICTRYLNTLNELLPKFNELGVDVIAISADTEDRATIQLADIKPEFAVGYDMSIAQMQSLGLYISDPRSEAESDRPFPEPGLFMINEQGNIQIIDISNAPFARPDLNVFLGGAGFVRNPENNYPIRGMHV
ncbi:MAG: peroxiredoxin [Candidatus Azotimanducaceae bacterium]|jgi:peroxiredoxin